MTDAADGGIGGSRLDSLFDALADGRRRRLLRTVLEAAPESVSERDLAAAVAAPEHDCRREDVTHSQRWRATISLRQADLPKLEAAGLIERAAEGGAVALADHPAYEDRGVREVLEGETTAGSEALDALFRAVADARRRTILDVLSHQYGPVHVETLAREIGADERDVTESSVPDGDVGAILVTLRHVHLPRLADAGLVEYDPAEGTVAYAGHPALRVPWMHSVLSQEFRGSLGTGSGTSEVWTIEGRQNVVSFGQSLCDRADESLFCAFTDADLLEAGCLTRLRDASRQGVAVYIGTRDPDIRAYAREHAPEVVLWEPETDWLDLPVEGDRVGRLVVVDGEAVMLGTLGQDADDAEAEQAIVGEGADNPLVVMVRQLLLPRVARLEADTGGAEDAGAHLPF